MYEFAYIDEFKYSSVGIFCIIYYLFKVRFLLDQIYLIETKPYTDMCHHCVNGKNNLIRVNLQENC